MNGYTENDENEEIDILLNISKNKGKRNRKQKIPVNKVSDNFDRPYFYETTEAI